MTHDLRTGVRLASPIALSGADSQPFVARLLSQRLPTVDWEPSPCDAAPDVCLNVLAERSGDWFEIETVKAEDARLYLRAGSRASLVSAVHELANRVAVQPGAIVIQEGTLRSEPSLPVRLLWTWDHSTNWDVLALGRQQTGAFNPYGKQRADFLSDYRQLLDFCSANRLSGVVIYGLLRDDHGGLEAAQEVCAFAAERGLRVVAGVGINAYGGVYYDGRHPYNLATWLRQHPELAVELDGRFAFEIDDYGVVALPRGDYTCAARPDDPRNDEWHRDAVRWLAESLDIGGINLDFGDYTGGEPLSHMRRLLPSLAHTISSVKPEALVLAELGWDNLLEPSLFQSIDGLPPDCLYQHTFNRSYWARLRKGLDRRLVAALPTSRNILRTHMGSQWNRERQRLVARDYAEMCTRAAASGMTGVTVFGEVSPYHVPNEFNYLAFSRFAWDVEYTWERFVAHEIAPRLGGDEAADRYLQLLDAAETPDRQSRSQLNRIRAEAASSAAGLEEHVARRWLWLAERAARIAFVLERRSHT